MRGMPGLGSSLLPVCASLQSEASLSVIVIVVPIPRRTIRGFVSRAEAPVVSVSVAVLEVLDRPHPTPVAVSSFLQSSHIDIARVILPSLVLTFAESVAITTLVPVLMRVLSTALSVIVTIVPILRKGRVAEHNRCKQQSASKHDCSSQFLHGTPIDA